MSLSFVMSPQLLAGDCPARNKLLSRDVKRGMKNYHRFAGKRTNWCACLEQDWETGGFGQFKMSKKEALDSCQQDFSRVLV